ncbi:MAG: N-acetyltransferase [Bacteroidaceae bacterium]|nr:N-acetyltransferase [Bacteroidaceae bacterium]
MAITIKKVASKKDLKTFIRFNYTLYKDVPYAVPELYEDMVDTLTPGRNPALEFCEFACFLALKDGVTVVGRVAAIINKRANERWGKKAVRFGWIDFIDDLEVSTMLLDAVVNFGRQYGMEEIEGPLGFTDMDPEGMLVEGYQELGTMATIYNFPYYPVHMQKLGYEKAADWVEFRSTVPDQIPEKMIRISDIVKKRFDLHTVKLTRKLINEKNYGQKIFDLINESYTELFGFVTLTPAQIQQYVKTYLSLLNLDMVCLVENAEGKLVGVGISMGSLSVAFQKAKGKLFPFGWYHLLKALKWKDADTVDLLLVAIKPEYQNKGVNSILFRELIPVYQRRGFKWSESNPELETNSAVQKQWEYFETRLHKRRRCFMKKIGN